eukprot:g55430.t1
MVTKVMVTEAIASVSTYNCRAGYVQCPSHGFGDHGFGDHGFVTMASVEHKAKWSPGRACAEMQDPFCTPSREKQK